MWMFCRYFEGGVSSVYLWDLDHGFAGVILIKKAGDGSKKIKGCWDSIHVVEVQVRTRIETSVGWGVGSNESLVEITVFCQQEKSSGRTAHYKLTSTVMLWLQTTKTGSGTMNLGGSLTRQVRGGSLPAKNSCSPVYGPVFTHHICSFACFPTHRWRKTRRSGSLRPTSPTSAAWWKSVPARPLFYLLPSGSSLFSWFCMFPVACAGFKYLR